MVIISCFIFQINKVTFSVVNVYMHYSDNINFIGVKKMVQNSFEENDLVMILGDFTGFAKNKGILFSYVIQL